MKHTECSHEGRILNASRTGNWTDDLRAHIAGCDSCADLALVTAYLSTSAEAEVADAALPAGGYLWRRAQNVAKAQAMERALRPIVWTRRFAFAACAAAVFAAFITWRSQLGGFFGGLVQSLAPRASAIPAEHTSTLLFVTALFLVMLVPLVFGLYVAWAED